MAQIDEKQIEEIVSQVLRTLQQDAPGTVQPTASVGASSSQSGSSQQHQRLSQPRKPHKQHWSNLGLPKDEKS